MTFSILVVRLTLKNSSYDWCFEFTHETEIVRRGGASFMVHDAISLSRVLVLMTGRVPVVEGRKEGQKEGYQVRKEGSAM
jgi:hypothetical protein